MKRDNEILYVQDDRVQIPEKIEKMSKLELKAYIQKMEAVYLPEKKNDDEHAA